MTRRDRLSLYRIWLLIAVSVLLAVELVYLAVTLF